MGIFSVVIVNADEARMIHSFGPCPDDRFITEPLTLVASINIVIVVITTKASSRASLQGNGLALRCASRTVVGMARRRDLMSHGLRFAE